MLILKNRTPDYIYWVNMMRSYITPGTFECNHNPSDLTYFIFGVDMYIRLFHQIHPYIDFDKSIQESYVKFRKELEELDGRGFLTTFFYERAVTKLINKEDFSNIVNFIEKHSALKSDNFIDIGIQSIDEYHLFPLLSYPLGMGLCRAELTVMAEDLGLPHAIFGDGFVVYYDIK